MVWFQPDLHRSAVGLRPAISTASSHSKPETLHATAAYAALDPSYRLVRDARTARSAETAEYYAFLRSHTLIPPGERAAARRGPGQAASRPPRADFQISIS